jgi:hypothetical protein
MRKLGTLEFEYKVTKKEDACTESVHLGGEAQLLVHSEGGKSDIVAIQIVDNPA